jgi:hypothetical protein
VYHVVAKKEHMFGHSGAGIFRISPADSSRGFGNHVGRDYFGPKGGGPLSVFICAG